jgi:hypothetical protein
MLYRVHTNDSETVEITTPQLLNMLLSKITSASPPQERLEMHRSSIQYLNALETLPDMTIQEIIALGFELGYFYKVFLSKNAVDIHDEPTNDDDSSEPTN